MKKLNKLIKNILDHGGVTILCTLGQSVLIAMAVFCVLIPFAYYDAAFNVMDIISAFILEITGVLILPINIVFLQKYKEEKAKERKGDSK